MKFNDFYKIFKDKPVIDSTTFSFYVENPNNLRRQVSDWVKKKYLLQIKRGLYVFAEEYNASRISSLDFVNVLMMPSYISLEYALAHYGLIPERVGVHTAVTTKKTVRYDNHLGVFEYRNIKKTLFFGYQHVKNEKSNYFIGEPEKVVLDFFYFNSKYKGTFGEFDSIRLQNLDQLNIAKLDEYSLQFNERIKLLIAQLILYIHKSEVDYQTI